MLHNFRDGQAVINISIQHPSNKVYTVFRERQEGNSKGMIEDFIDIVERILFVNNRIEKDSQGPDILLFPSVRFALKDFRRCIVFTVLEVI